MRISGVGKLFLVIVFSIIIFEVKIARVLCSMSLKLKFELQNGIGPNIQKAQIILLHVFSITLFCKKMFWHLLREARDNIFANYDIYHVRLLLVNKLLFY